MVTFTPGRGRRWPFTNQCFGIGCFQLPRRLRALIMKAAKQQGCCQVQGMLYETGNQKCVVAISVRHTVKHKQDLNLPETERENQPKCEVGSFPVPLCQGHVRKPDLPCEQPRFSRSLSVLKACPHHSFAVILLPNICLL